MELKIHFGFFLFNNEKKVDAIFLYTETHRENLNANKFISLFFLSLSLSLVYHIHSLNWIGLSWFHSFKNFFIFFLGRYVYIHSQQTHTHSVWLTLVHDYCNTIKFSVCVCAHTIQWLNHQSAAMKPTWSEKNKVYEQMWIIFKQHNNTCCLIWL